MISLHFLKIVDKIPKYQFITVVIFHRVVLLEMFFKFFFNKLTFARYFCVYSIDDIGT